MVGELASHEPDDARPVASQLRASHEDRDAIIEVLRVAAGDGRLTAEELDERLELAFNARTYGELARLTTDLPVGAMPAPGPPAPAAAAVTPKDVMRLESTSGHVVKDGGWVVPKRLEVKVASGHVRLDLTEAVFTYPVLEITAQVASGHLRIITKPGVAVDTDDVKVLSGHVRVKAPWAADVPVTLRVNLSGNVASGHILAGPRRPRRTFWQWLTRQPHRPWAGTENAIGSGQQRRLTQAG
jgi:Domain of unknown function (DUF1707)